MHGAPVYGGYATGNKELTAGECPPATSGVDIRKQCPDTPLLQCPLRRSHADINHNRKCESRRRRGEVGSPKSYWPHGFIRQGWRPNRSPATTVPDPMGDLGGPSGQRGRPTGSMEWSRDARQTLRTVWSGGQVCARP